VLDFTESLKKIRILAMLRKNDLEKTWNHFPDFLQWMEKWMNNSWKCPASKKWSFSNKSNFFYLFPQKKTSMVRFYRKSRDPVQQSKTDRDISGFMFDRDWSVFIFNCNWSGYMFDRDRDHGCNFKTVVRLQNNTLEKSFFLKLILLKTGGKYRRRDP